eukprot:g81249.t1
MVEGRGRPRFPPIEFSRFPRCPQCSRDYEQRKAGLRNGIQRMYCCYCDMKYRMQLPPSVPEDSEAVSAV